MLKPIISALKCRVFVTSETELQKSNALNLKARSMHLKQYDIRKYCVLIETFTGHCLLLLFLFRNKVIVSYK